MGELPMKKFKKKFDKFIDKNAKAIAILTWIVFGGLGMYWGYVQ